MNRVNLDPMLGEPIEVRVDASADDGLEAAYRRLYPSLVRTAYLLVDTREQAEEVAQEARRPLPGCARRWFSRAGHSPKNETAHGQAAGIRL